MSRGKRKQKDKKVKVNKYRDQTEPTLAEKVANDPDYLTRECEKAIATRDRRDLAQQRREYEEEYGLRKRYGDWW